MAVKSSINVEEYKKLIGNGGKQSKASKLEAAFEEQLILTRCPEWQKEYRFDPKRRSRMDFAWPELKIAVEIEGATWSGGRHTTGSGFESDCEKYNRAAEQGWTVYRYTAGMVRNGEAIRQIVKVLKEAKGGE